ncbi:uncharacterized protein I303_106595 [Kwoniella dejecticola CBS 10117]|uniref:Protein Zds1 C-terminal domain-containing protein n=1 Tax=Kwoniella dejecticola CBS 10117 TaxID=1296121 RepID=A0A1A5ZU90_9TREE|nr:uncharacterized protein I303_08148 [Kwoniella dejecticola CBS 10117]OBR81378.1 hypothetical protein I303_08148 [Kwoniella dejecticola CBS 10117]
MPSEVSDQEIEREINTLRNLRRRSITSAGPGALPLDPDLPPPSPVSRPESSGSLYDTNDDITLSTPDGLSGEDAGLFWVPAHLHPELAPGEFRAFLKSHTHPDPTHADGTEAGEAPGLSRSPSWIARNPSRRGSEGLGRKRSMLSRQYQPKLGDNVENEAPPLPTRRPASIYGGRSGEKGLTLNDLQKLEELVDEAEDVEDDPEAMRTLLRRSLSMNVAPGFLQDDIPQGGEIDDEPLIPSSRPGSILRRSARTKIRGKASLSGDGGGHRFAATRKGRMTAAPQRELPVFEDEFDYSDRTKKSSTGTTSSAGGSDENASAESHEEKEVFHDSVQHLEDRRGSDESTDEAHIFDAYARDSRSSSMSSSSQDHSTSPSPENSPPGKKLSLPPMITTSAYQPDGSDWFASDNDLDRTPTQETIRDPLAGIRRTSPGSEMQLDRPAIPSLSNGPNLQIPDETYSQKPPSPTTPQQRPASLPADQYDLPPGMAPPAQRSSLPPGMAMQQQQESQQMPAAPQPMEQKMTPVNLSRTESGVSTASSTGSKEKEKQKKGGLFGKKDKKDKDGKSKKDKDNKFLGSLFGGNKKKQEEISSVSNFSSAGPAAAAALLGSSKSAKSLGVPPSPSPTSPGFSSYARYPIHVERAVYRLSHIKLANARRPLYEQVLISNLMFWYLGVIGRNVTEEKKSTSSDPENKKEEVKVPVKGTPPKPADSGSAGKALPRSNPIESSAPTPAPPTLPSNKKSGLTKPERARDGRNSEAPMRAPSYGMQNAQVDHELRSQPPPNKQSPPPPRPPSQQSLPPQQSYNPHQQPPPNHQQGPRPLPQNAPQRALSQPPMNGSGPRSPNEGYHLSQQQQQQQHRPPHPQQHPQNIRGPPGGVPQSSFGPPPQGHGPTQPILTGLDDRRDTRQRTMSNPNHPPPVMGPGPNSGGMRRVVTDGRPPDGHGQGQGQVRPLYPQHSGPQPGQIFHHPSASNGPGPASPFPNRPNGLTSPGPQPGQIFNQPQPGQIYQQQQRPPPPPHYGPGQGPQGPQGSRPLPPPGAGGNWEPPQRLPPGAGPPHAPGQGQGQGQQFRPLPGPGQPTQGYDPRRGGPVPPPPAHQPYNPQQTFYGGQPPPRPQSQPQVGQVYGYQSGGGYGHHR